MQVYRPEIDGLRSIAVLAVVVYHAEFVLYGHAVLPGGFIGVDVFFVISGYLISNIVLREVAIRKFSFARFYERRARRILPSFFVVLLATLPMAHVLLSTKALEEFKGSLVSSLFFSSNFWFWLEDAYTAEPSRYKPLLHTWTLSIEEQFYLLFPVLVLVLVRYSRHGLLQWFIALGLVSLVTSQIASSSNPSSSFFLLHTRAWELLAGCVLAAAQQNGWPKPASLLEGFLPIAGLLMIIYAVVSFEDGMQHPSITTLIPVLGTCFIIAFAKERNLTARILSNGPMVGIGLISYSLYLWHYPLFAFFRVGLGEPTTFGKFVLIGAALVLATLTYFLIEKPFRNEHIVKLNLFSALMIVAGLVIIASVFVQPSRMFSTTDSNIAEFSFTPEQVEAGKQRRFLILKERCAAIGWDNCDTYQPGKSNILIVGDSHVPDALNALHSVFPNAHFVKSTLAGCPPTPDIRSIVKQTHPNLTKCESLNEARFDPAGLQNFDIIVISYLGGWFKPSQLEPYLDHLRQTTNAPVVILGNYIVLDTDFPEILTKPSGLENLVEYEQSRFLYDDEYRTLADAYGVIFISKRDLLCTEIECPVFADGVPFSWDKHHLSLEFAQLMGERLQTRLRPLLE